MVTNLVSLNTVLHIKQPAQKDLFSNEISSLVNKNQYTETFLKHSTYFLTMI